MGIKYRQRQKLKRKNAYNKRRKERGKELAAAKRKKK